MTTPTACPVRDPVRTAALHHGDSAVRDHQDPPVPPRAIMAALDEALEIIDAPESRDIGDGRLRIDKRDADPLGSEQRLHDEPPSQGQLARDQGLGLDTRLAHPGLGRRDARLLQEHAGHGLVHRALDGACVVVDHDPEYLEDVQHIEPQGHLFEAPARHPAHEHPGRQTRLEPRDHDRVRSAEVDMTLRQRDIPARVATRRERPLELGPMPARLVGDDGDARGEVSGIRYDGSVHFVPILDMSLDGARGRL